MVRSHIHGKDLWKLQEVKMVHLQSGGYDYQVVMYDKGLPAESYGKDFI
jgi:hypothetical protein